MKVIKFRCLLCNKELDNYKTHYKKHHSNLIFIIYRILFIFKKETRYCDKCGIELNFSEFKYCDDCLIKLKE